jgi:predicted MFS family arabinose efflux permease
MIAVTFGLARYGYGLLLPEMQSDLGLSPGAAGLIGSAAYLSYLIATLGVVWVMSRLAPQVVIGLAAALAAAGMTVIAAAGNPPTLAIGVLVSGTAAGLAFPPYADLVAQRVSERRRDLAWSTISSGTGWGVAIAAPIAIAAGDQWRVAWLVFVALTVGAGIAAVRLSPQRRSNQQLRRPQLSWTWFFCPKSRPLLVSAVLIGTGSAVWWAFSVEALREAGIAATPARVVYAVCGAAGVLASVSGAGFTRFGLRAGYLASCALLAGSLALVGIAAHHLVAAVCAAILFGVFYNTVIAAQGIWSSRVFADHPAAGIAAVNTALTVGTLTGPSIAGAAITTFGFPATLIGAALAVGTALAFCPPSRARRRILAAHQCDAAPVKT